MLQFIPKVFSGVEALSSWSLLTAQVHCYAGAGLGLLVQEKGNYNTTVYKDILYNCVLITL